MPKTCGIYKITSPSGKIYIGQSKHIEARLRSYRKRAVKAQTKIYHSIRKHGFDTHTIEILAVCSQEELDDEEVFYVWLYDTFNTSHGLNLTRGGCNYRGIVADSTKAKHRAYRHTPESIAKIVAANTGRKLSEEAKQNMRKPHKKGFKFEGRTRPCPPVFCKDGEGIVLRFRTIKECGEVLGLDKGVITNSINRKKYYKEYCFSRTNDWSSYRKENLRGKTNPRIKAVYRKDSLGNVDYYESTSVAMERTGIAFATLKSITATGRLYKNRYYFSFTTFDK